MAKATFKNNDERVTIHLAGDSEPAAEVAAGESVTTDNEDLKKALKLAGFTKAK